MKTKDSTNKESIDNDEIFFSFKTLRCEHKEHNQEVLKEDNEIINIYHHNMPQKLERKTFNGFKIFIIGIIILLISGAGFYYYGKSVFTGGEFFGGNNVELELEGLSEVSAGEEVSYIVKYQNLEKIDLSNVVLTVNYPQSFVYKKSKPLANGKNNNSWDLGYVKSGASGQVEITGALIGEQDQKDLLRAELSYNLGGDKSSGVKKTEMELKISSAVLSLNIDGPARLLGKDIQYTINYVNNSDSAVEDIKITATYPKGFVFTESKPVAPQENSANSVWLITQLKEKQEGSIVISGHFEASQDGQDMDQEKEKTFGVQIGILDSQDVFYVQQEKEFKTTISNSDLVIGVGLVGAGEKSVVALGEDLKYNINYSNQGKEDLKDVEMKLLINSNILDWSSIKPDGDGVLKDEEIINGMLARSITWSLKEVKAGESGVYNVEVKSKTFSQLDRTKTLDLKVEAKIQAKIGMIGEDRVDINIEGGGVVSQVNTELGFDTKVIAKNETDYQLEWQLTNSIHEVSDVKVVAKLSDDVEWLSNASVTAGDIYFDNEARTVSWQINRIPVGVEIPLVAKFNLKSSSDGRPKLLNSITVSAVDKVTGLEINQLFSEVMGM